MHIIISTRRADMIAREDLYELVWSMPMTRVAQKFSVSGSYMARVCSVLGVPRPERGYWAKLEVGKAPPRPALPEALPGDQQFWSQDGDPQAMRLRAVTATSAPAQARPRRSVTGIHGLIQGAKQHYERGYKVDEGQLLRPYKRQLVDVTASAEGLDKALAFANGLFNALESAGHRVCFAPNATFDRPYVDEHEANAKPTSQENPHRGSDLWRPSRPTVVYVGNVPFGLAVIEMTEAVLMRYVNDRYVRESDYRASKTSRRHMDHTWTTTKSIPCGRLRVVVFSPHRDVSWSISFQETVERTLTQDIAKIVKSMRSSTEIVQKEIDAAEHRALLREQQWEADQARWRHQADQRQIAKSINDSREQLNQVIEAWARVVSIEQFFKGVEERVSNLSEGQRAAVQERLRLAREFIGVQDPLDFLLSWKTPGERYAPLTARTGEENP
ncbi:MAG TPA: hypothetical protein VKB38_09545 [Terracidiphilus sp.]|nr:hypothetical protein [Terracidiphilus sp.]